MGFFERLKSGLTKTRDSVFGKIDSFFKSFSKVDEDVLDELEEILITSDVGVQASEEIIDQLREKVKEEHITDPSLVREEFIGILKGIIGENRDLDISSSPAVILIIGVNGVGKTTSIGKISKYLRDSGKKVLVAAADTFRAAAIEQLTVWTERAGVDIIAQSEGSDPAAVVYDAISSMKSRKSDVLIVDTAGRLHNKKNLMDELSKINRVIEREIPDARRETLLVIDATTGQNGLVQAKEFINSASITGIILTKLDGTAKGGIIIPIISELKIPVKFIGVGEGIDDMQPFDVDEFTKALFD
ncbi:MAG: signal recognition particle-docking protein FtsY [Clostridia bacterium]|nr:signal recognition particle-docking protein FtsY [Clostridia bacterium]